MKAKQRIVNLVGLAFGLGVFLVVALIVTHKQVALNCRNNPGSATKSSRVSLIDLMLEGRGE